jgi:anthranilate synthase/aminodeoxychorismate synthase-like glutamine amidotransferase
MIILIDNYDSFTYNLFQYFSELGARVQVIRNDAESAQRVLARRPKKLVLSPGPGRPQDAGICLDLIALAPTRLPILGVCLGHQAIAQACGAKIVSAPRLMHGKTSPIVHDQRGLFRGLPRPLIATRYHSLTVAPKSIPRALQVSARTSDGVIMGLRHKKRPLYGVQFHPESILTTDGKKLLKNFLGAAR